MSLLLFWAFVACSRANLTFARLRGNLGFPGIHIYKTLFWNTGIRVAAKEIITPLIRIILVKLKILKLTKKFPVFYSTLRFIQCLQQPETCLYPEPD